MPLGGSISGTKSASVNISKSGSRTQPPKPIQAWTRGTSPGYLPKSAAERQAAKENTRTTSSQGSSGLNSKKPATSS